MTSSASVDALVLDTVAYRDKDLIVRLLTPTQGIVSAIAFSARNSRSRFPSGLDRLTRVEAVLSERPRGMPVCKSASTREVFWELRADLDRSAVAALLCDVLLHVHVDAAEAEGLFDFCLESLATLAGKDLVVGPNVAVFLVLGVLRRLGFLPAELTCPSCPPGHRAEAYRLRSDSGAIWCREHDRPGPYRVPLTAADVTMMQRAVGADGLADFAAARDGAERGVMNLLDTLIPWVERVLDGRLKSFSFLRSLYAQQP